MRERELLRIVAERLKAEGLADMQVRYSGPGVDLQGTLPRSRRTLYLEAKGVRKNQYPRVAIGEALLQILSRWDPHVACALALPYTEEFVRTIREILPGLKQLKIYAFFVREDKSISYLEPDTALLTPTEHKTLIEVLNR